MTDLAVNEIFPTLQGEGRWVGTPATFIRLQGCPVGCPWCDTKHTWPDRIDRKRVEISEMLRKRQSAPTWAAMSAHQVVEAALRFRPRHFVITGGEPAAQDIYELTVLLARQGRVQLETSGTFPINVAADTWVTVSPKPAMPGGYEVRQDALRRANEIKMPVAEPMDIDQLDALLVGRDLDESVISLQPVSIDPEATALCIKTCMARNWSLSLQTHKFTGVR